MENCLQALHEYEAMKMTGAVANTYLLLANVSKDMSGQNRTNNYVDNGIIYTKAAYKAFSSVSDTAGLVSSLITSGILFRDKAIQSNQNFFYDTAFTNYTTALKLIESTKKGVQQLPRLYNNISQVYIEYKKDYRKALEYLFKAVAKNEGNKKQSTFF